MEVHHSSIVWQHTGTKETGALVPESHCHWSQDSISHWPGPFRLLLTGIQNTEDKAFWAWTPHWQEKETAVLALRSSCSGQPQAVAASQWLPAGSQTPLWGRKGQSSSGSQLTRCCTWQHFKVSLIPSSGTTSLQWNRTEQKREIIMQLFVPHSARLKLYDISLLLRKYKCLIMFWGSKGSCIHN